MCPAMRSRWIFTLPMMALLLPAVSLRAQNQSSQGHAQGTGNDQHGNDPNDEELAKEVQNPLADLIQVQVGNDFGFGGGTGNRLQYLMTLQPVIPIKLSNDWNLITRSTFNAVSMPDFDSETARITGASDLAMEFYFSPHQSTSVVWGFGPALAVPTASEPSLGTGKWSLGPGFAVIKQTEHWTYGLVANHVWSFAGNQNRENVSSTFIQPALYYTWGSGWTLGVDTETTYDSLAPRGEKWTVPVQIAISKVTNFLGRPVNFSLGIIPYAVAPPGSPSVAINFTVTPLFPRNPG